MLLNNITKGVSTEIFKYFEINENKFIQKFCSTKVTLKGKFIALMHILKKQQIQNT
jgi:hypothetical protein